MLRVARRIATARLAKGLTQEELAQRLGIATKNLQRVESGRQNLTLRTLEGVAAALGVDAAELVARPVFAHAHDGLATLVTAGVAVLPRTPPPRRRTLFQCILWRPPRAPRAGDAVERLAWAVVPGRGGAGTGRRFLARAAGRSMEPLIDGAWCLFKPTLVAAPSRGASCCCSTAICTTPRPTAPTPSSASGAWR